MSRRRVAGLIALGALALTASYPPFTLPVLSFFALTPMVLLVRECVTAADPRRAFRWGFWYGVASQGLVLYWLVVALWHFTALAALGYLATIAILGLETGVLFWFTVRVRLRFPRVPLALVLPIAWTALEWVLGHQGDISFPWLGLGTSLADAPVLVQWADLAGAHGVTWWLVWCNVLIAEALLALPVWRIVAREVGAVLVTIALALGYGVWRERTLPVRGAGVVGLVQPNVGFREKWNWSYQDSVVARTLALARRIRTQARPDLIIWPESAVPWYLAEKPAWDQVIAQFAAESHTPVLTGVLHAESAGGVLTSYNAAVLYDSTGLWRRWPVYEKHYLVPVVERVPFVPVAWFRKVPWLDRWSGGFGRGKTLPLYPTSAGRFGVIICYESIFEDMARGYRRAGADFLVNITNDGWYGRTAGPYQHASHLVMRAIENRMGVARAANTGITEFVDPLGHAYDQTALEQEVTVADQLRTSDVVPLYVTLGDWVGLLSVLATLGFAGALAVQGWKGSAT
ncbi:MAG: apolipoprotein N-acyltransferase [Gemmatimonadetes bacterium 13_1_40CM_70_11]|nr:MAG: apolipoprotein N-acyltransferase [Gemmatimonadetes bacterium 13_1_40CM_70_11]